jgi:hypothetical protein
MRSSCAIIAVVTAIALSTAADRVGAIEPQIAAERPTGPTVDFIALDAQGTPVVDLQPSEIEVRIADRPRTVRTLRRVSAVASAATAARVPAPYGTNGDVAAGRRFLIVIDQESFAAGREHLFRSAIDGLVAQFTPADRAMFAELQL